ncbi:MAG: PTS sugar transporter subunit IIA [Spirochaetales bacterium]|nr:PTS sugar transporter subunit IIA [Spirochaetales bacterium]
MNTTTKHAIVKNLESNDKYEAIKELISNLPLLDESFLREELTDAVIQREKIMSTGLGNGVAIAHGRIPSIRNTYICLGISRNGIEYNSEDGKPVHFLFLIAHHPDMQNSYLKVLSTIAGLVDKTIIKADSSCEDFSQLELLVSSSFSHLFCVSLQ